MNMEDGVDGIFVCPLLLHRLCAFTIHTHFTWNVKQAKNAVESCPKDLLGAGISDEQFETKHLFLSDYISNLSENRRERTLGERRH